MVFDNTDFRLVNSRTQEGYVFAPATLPKVFYGFLAVNSRFTAAGDSEARLGRAWDVEASENGYAAGQTSNGQVVIRDSVINEGFNTAKPWGDAAGSKRPFTGNTGTKDEKENIQRDLNDGNANRLWEFNNRGVGSPVAAE